MLGIAGRTDGCWWPRWVGRRSLSAADAFWRAAGAEGRFVIVSSEQAQHPSSTNAAYAAAKAAAETWTLAYADELAKSDGAANIVVVKQITDRNAPRIADAIALLLSDTGASMNGQRLVLHR